MLYAIGEIVLVVIGILIALQINNWNENRKQDDKINSYLKSMSIDLKNDVNAYERIIQNFKKQINTNSTIFTDKDYKMLPIDSIVPMITSYYESHTIVDQTYQKIKNSGLAGELRSKELNNAINEYYADVATRFYAYIDFDRERTITDDEYWFYTDAYEIHISFNDEITTKLPYAEPESKRKQALIAMIETNRGRNYLRANIGRKTIGVAYVESTKAKANELIQIINEASQNK